eukprot:g6260.t2
MFVAAAAAVPRSISRFVVSNGKSPAGRQQVTAAAARGLSSVFRPTPGVRKSAAVESLDDWDEDVPPASKINPACIVNSHTEWDPLEEVIVGRVDDATIPEWHVSGKAVWPAKHWDMYKNHVGESFPKELVNKAAEELDNFSHILEMEGVTVRRPEVRPGDFNRPVSTPDFESETQLYAAMPRDVLIVVSATGCVGC